MIFESPDGGRTVYARKHGSSSRTLIRVDEETEKHRRLVGRRDRLLKICELAETNPTLNDQLLKLEELFILLNDDKDD